jgi:hypothetical protein
MEFLLIGLHPYYSNFKQSLIFPENLANKSFLEEKIINDFKLERATSLIYFNDKYLFFQIYSGKEGKILVLDFNEFIKTIPEVTVSTNNGNISKRMIKFTSNQVQAVK